MRFFKISTFTLNAMDLFQKAPFALLFLLNTSKISFQDCIDRSLELQ